MKTLDKDIWLHFLHRMVACGKTRQPEDIILMQLESQSNFSGRAKSWPGCS